MAALLFLVLRLEKTLRASENKCLEVQEDYNRFRREQRKTSASALHADIAKLQVSFGVISGVLGLCPLASEAG